jgi:hypothetical protein
MTCEEVQVHKLEVDLMGRTVQFKTMDGQLVAIAAKSTKALIMSQVFTISVVILHICIAP